jgi:integrase
MRTATIVFTETLLRKMSADPAHRGNDFTDAGCRNLVIYIAKDGVVTFTFRKRVKEAPTGRVFEGLGTWSSAFTLTQARDACAVWRTKLSQDGFKPKIEKKSVLASIQIYEAARKQGDKQTSRKGTPLPGKWEEYLERFKKVFPDLLRRDVNELQRPDFMGAMAEYGRKEYTAKGKEWDWRVLRPMMVHMMPMLRWYTKRYNMNPKAIEDIVPPDYDEDTRYLLPGEWQACAPHVDGLTGLDEHCGLFERFVLYTCARSKQVLKMQWDEVRWGQWKTWKDDAGREHRALIWIPPRENAKARNQKGGEKLPRRVLITGEALTVLEKLRAIWEENVKLPEHADWNGVFPERVVHRWYTARTEIQRGIEEKGGTKPWDRMTLRHTHATYLGYLGCPPRLISMSMNHTPREKGQGAATVTDRYNKADASARFMTADPLAELAPWHLRLHKLIRDIERGNMHSADLAAMQEDMRDSQQVRDMCDPKRGYNINRRFIEVEESKLRAVK